jgi:hypothetical protein
MSIFKPIGVLVGAFLVAIGVLGWRATRRPFQEWGIVVSWLKEHKVEDTADSSADSASQNVGSAADNTPPRPNKSLERTREG